MQELTAELYDEIKHGQRTRWRPGKGAADPYNKKALAYWTWKYRYK